MNERTPFEPATLYPPASQRTTSPGNTTYFIDPNKGCDTYSGKASNRAWKSFARLNAMSLAPGDKVLIAAGFHAVTLKPSGAGSAEHPVVIQFLPGRHEFGVAQALRRPYYISNSCDAPHIPKPIGILMERVRHFRIQGGGVSGHRKTDIVYMGRMVEIVNDHAEDITFSGLTFDLKRPTVSEFRVLENSHARTLIQVAEGSDYAIKDGKFVWLGDWGIGRMLCQEVDLETFRCWRRRVPPGWNLSGQSLANARDLGGRKVELKYKNGTSGLTAGHQFQFRATTRDSVGVHNTRSKNLIFQDCDFYILTNMGFVSQFTENITYRRVHVAPPVGTLRTCAAWADIFHFSNCKGEMIVEGCRLSGMQDDAINCHGTHLRIIKKTATNQLLLRFMNKQTYGFAAFQAGDEVAVIDHSTLRELPNNPRRKVTELARNPNDKSGKEWLLTLDGSVPAFGKNDVIDNITWHPSLTARNNHVSIDPVRGFLITTRGKVLIEGNTFLRCKMAGILVEDDAKGWYESGPVRDLTIRENNFVGCGIQISPHNGNSDPALPVHENIRIEDNFFDGKGIKAKSTRELSVIDNRTTAPDLSVRTTACTDVKIEGTIPNQKAVNWSLR